MVSSADPETIVLPDGVNATEYTGPLCPTNLKGLTFYLKFQTITVPSKEPLTTCLRFGLNIVDKTPSLCPLKDLFNAGSARPEAVTL
jgi:hypothetical protein